MKTTCPACTKLVTVAKNGKPYKHQTKRGYDCDGVSYNDVIRARNEATRAQIMQLRPNWNREELNNVTHGYRGIDNKPGLWDILEAIKATDELEAKFAGNK